jgi:predicted GNAT family acetyltransferase
MKRHPTHTLDRAIWHALSGCQSAFAEGNASALRYRPDYTPFAATIDDTTDSLNALTGIMPNGATVAVVTRNELTFPDALAVSRRALIEQMLLTNATIMHQIPGLPPTARPLGDSDVPAMLALTALTQPGPFAARTHALGRYLGAFEGDTLIAMAGERMCLDGFVEISAVCTHPDHRGKALSGRLIAALARPALARGETPFLHVFNDNTPALAVYKRLGFSIRATFHLAAVTRASG